MAKRKMKKELRVSLIIVFVLIFSIGGVLLYKNLNKPKSEVIIKKPTEKSSKITIIDEDSKTRPIAVMINNISVARPYHSGLQEAYIIYEIVAEGGITRYLALFKDTDTKRIGSIRSARDYYLDYVMENDAIFIHYGGSPEALSNIKSLKLDHIDGISYGNKYFYRDNPLNISSEHTAFSNMELIKKGITDLKIRTSLDKEHLLKYKKDLKLKDFDNLVVANNVDINFSNSNTSSFKYDKEAKAYKMYINGKEHIDFVSKKIYTFKNIITYQVKNSLVPGDDKNRQKLHNIGSGEGYYITEGLAVPIKWEKKSKSSKTVYTFMDGKTLEVNDGNTYIAIQPTSGNLNIGE